MNLLRLTASRCSRATTTAFCSKTAENSALSNAEVWKRRRQFVDPKIQRLETPKPKIYYAPEWELGKTPTEDEKYKPRHYCYTTPEKWEYQNKVVWPVGHVVPETGLPKAREVFHCSESIHHAPKKIWYTCQFVLRMNVEEAILQLNFIQKKGCLIMAKALTEAKRRAKEEFYISDPSKMFVAEAFAVQYQMLKSKRRHARENWQTIRHRYINLYVRLEEGEGPGYKGKKPLPNGWENMDTYYEYLRNREFKYSI